MTRARRLAAACLLAAALPAARLSAQASPYVPLDDVAYRYIDALTARGLLGELSALDRPYTTRAIREAIGAARETAPSGVIGSWLDALADAIGRSDIGGAAAPGGDALRAGASLAAFVTAQSSGRRELMLADDSSAVEPGLALRLGIGAGPVVAAARLLGDRRLRTDPEFAGKKDRSVMGRVEDSYLSAQWRYGELFLGRVARNWGPAQLDGLALGHYAYSYDHLFGRIGDRRVSLSVLAARLDELPITADSVAQRYFTIHRLAGRWRGLELGASESVVYGGVERGMELSLLNPLNLYDLAQYNEGEAINVGYTLEAAWHGGAAGLYAVQFLLDDIQVDECVDLCDEPPSYGVTITAEGLPLVGAQRWFASYTRVSNLTYRTPQAYERYAVFGVGLGRGFADYDEARLGLDLALLPRTTLRVYGAHRRQGEGDYRLPFPAPPDYAATPSIFAGTTSRITRLGLTGAWRWRDLAEVTGDVGINRVSATNTLAGAAGRRLEGRVRVTLDLGALGVTLRP